MRRCFSPPAATRAPSSSSSAPAPWSRCDTARLRAAPEPRSSGRPESRGQPPPSTTDGGVTRSLRPRTERGAASGDSGCDVGAVRWAMSVKSCPLALSLGAVRWARSVGRCPHRLPRPVQRQQRAALCVVQPLCSRRALQAAGGRRQGARVVACSQASLWRHGDSSAVHAGLGRGRAGSQAGPRGLPALRRCMHSQLPPPPPPP